MASERLAMLGEPAGSTSFFVDGGQTSGWLPTVRVPAELDAVEMLEAPEGVGFAVAGAFVSITKSEE